ncbi:MAG: cupin domain-containing protein [Xanthomonadales bacterium]|nr:cupin domain-containing protein [Xanthomonadales bacterium]
MSEAEPRVSPSHGARMKSGLILSIGLVCGFLVNYSWATLSPPTEHKGLEVEELGFVPAESMATQMGLEGHILLLRKITINPGGQIARHSAATTPTVVHVISGTWTEGHASGETEYSVGETFIEDEATVHWFYNRGDEPAAAYVCDIKPAV